MRAFIEWIFRPSGIIRAGTACDKYGDPFDYAVVITLSWPDVVRWLLHIRPVPVMVKALVASEIRPFTQTHAKTMARLVRAKGFEAEWERFPAPKVR